MKKTLFLPAALALTLFSAACTQFETSREALSPSAPTPLPGGNTTGALVGAWVSPQDLPSASSCSSFEWEISSQSETAIAGTFSAQCGNGLSIAANVSGTLTTSTTATITATGNGFIGGLGCPFSLTSNATIIDNSNGIVLPYTGTTCFGPVSGTQTLHRPQPPVPPAPEPTPSPNDPPPSNANHVQPGPLTVDLAHQVIDRTYDEFPQLSEVFGSEGEAVGAAEELLLRTIWHLKLIGFDAARQRNPSSAISNDKITIFVDGAWHAYDIYSLGYGGRRTTVQMLEVGSPNPVPNDGIPD